MRLFFFITVILFFSSHHLRAEDKLPFSSTITSIPESSSFALKNSFSKESLPYWGIILGSTGILYRYDEDIYREGQKKGRDLRIGNEDNTKAAISFSGQEILRLPSDTGSALYFLGDGWTHASIAGGLMSYGTLKDNNRAYNTGIMIFHGMFVSTIFNQGLKRSFGRESPEVSTSKRGSWNLFPSFNDYNTKTASYDAMPSGHVMTATMTFTVLSERYPEYRNVLYPLGGLWICALSFQMVNNGVHWASDYPLGIAMGYIFGKASVKVLSNKSDTKVKDQEQSWMIIPSVNNQETMVKAVRAF